MKLPPALRVLRHRDFRLYWFGQGISLTGTWMQVMAQGWVVTRLSDAAWVLGALQVTSTLPILFLSMVAGAVADRASKRRLLVVTQIALMLLALTFAVLVFTGVLALWHIFVLAFCIGLATAFDFPAAQALPPELVQPDEIPKAVALMQAVFHGSRFVGPALAGLLVARFGEGSAFLANGLSFIAVIFTLVLIHERPRPRASGRHARGIAAGFRYVRADAAVRGLMLLAALTTTLVFPFVVVLMLYFVRHVLHADAEGMGVIMSVSGLGSLAGAVTLLFGSLATIKRWLAVGLAGIGVGLVGIASSHTVVGAMPGVLLLSYSVSSLMGRISQTIQHLVPGELRGRVMGLFGIAFTGIMPYSALLISALTDSLGFGTTLRLCAAAYVVPGALILLRMPRPEPRPEARPAGALV
jgi:MFS family permease